MRCTNCGNEIPEGRNFCEKCGAKFKPIPENLVTSMAGKPAVSNASAKKVNIPLIIILAAVGTILTAVLLFFIANAPKTISDERAQVMIEEVVEILQNHEDDSIDYDAAEKKISKKKLEKGSQYTEIFEEIKEIVAAKPRVVKTNSDDYPNVTVEFEVDGNVEYSIKDLRILDEYYDEILVSALEKTGKTYKFTY
ncbi:MAG: zinc ribbon domain-containing protein [Clostridia bacterium]|nr:zinc ribbon domain-containing protein [Clostridia bacterium]